MKKELQDLAWSCLPKEFKKEVKKYYRILHEQYKEYDGLHFENARAKVQERIVVLQYFFGEHNLTSDAEGEEMLTVSRKEVQGLYSKFDHAFDNVVSYNLMDHYRAKMGLLKALFGSKCLPNEEQPKQKDCDNPLADQEGCRWRNNGKCAFDSACYFEPLNPQEPKPAEAKYKVGDKVRLKDVYEIEEINEEQTMVGLKGCAYMEDIGNLEPYTEPEEPICTRTCTDDCPSQHKIPCVNLSQETANCDKCNDIRLHIAAMAMQGIMSASDPLMFSERGCLSAEAIARQALKYADALIAESEKGGRNEKA